MFFLTILIAGSAGTWIPGPQARGTSASQSDAPSATPRPPVAAIPAKAPEAPGHPSTPARETAGPRSETGHGEGQHASEGEDHGGGVPEIPNAVQLIYEYLQKRAMEEGKDPNSGMAGFFKTLHKGPLKEPLPIVGTIPWENHVFSVLAALLVLLLFRLGVRRMDVRSPSRWQMLVERVVGLFDDGIGGILGPKHGRIFAPYIMTLFVFILVNNLMVLVPFLKSSTSSLVMTGSLALLTFVIVQGTALISLGPLKYLYHLMGEPQGTTMWVLSPLFLVLHLVGELARPVSLALRLCGNILGEDILLGAFLGMGIALAGVIGLHPPLPGIPLHFPFVFLVLLSGTIQALVFSLLTTIYILLALPHDEGHHERELPEAEGAHRDSAAAAA